MRSIIGVSGSRYPAPPRRRCWPPRGKNTEIGPGFESGSDEFELILILVDGDLDRHVGGYCCWKALMVRSKKARLLGSFSVVKSGIAIAPPWRRNAGAAMALHTGTVGKRGAGRRGDKGAA